MLINTIIMLLVVPTSYRLIITIIMLLVVPSSYRLIITIIMLLVTQSSYRLIITIIMLLVTQSSYWLTRSVRGSHHLNSPQARADRVSASAARCVVSQPLNVKDEAVVRLALRKMLLCVRIEIHKATIFRPCSAELVSHSVPPHPHPCPWHPLVLIYEVCFVKILGGFCVCLVFWFFGFLLFAGFSPSHINGG